MKFNVGDVVRIISGDKLNEMEAKGIGVYPMASMIEGLKVEITEAKDEFYRFNVSSDFMFSEHVIEGLAEPFNKKELKESSEKLKTYKIGTEYFFELPEGYQFTDEHGNVINETKIVLEKKKKEYPKSYEECCKVLDIDDRELVFNGEYRASKLYWKQLGKLNVLNQILICRDAYWKIAGEEMGLGKPWEPDYETEDNNRIYVLTTDSNVVVKSSCYHCNYILAFPTEEMRDAFYENFKELIEMCKELL